MTGTIEPPRTSTPDRRAPTGSRSARASHGVVHAEGLGKDFGGTTVLDGVDLDIPAGELHALLGPNGAGKTTMVRILTTLLRPDRGLATMAGHDVDRDPDAVRRVIGLSGQYAAVDPYLSGHENLHMLARLHGYGGRAASARADELLDRFSLTEAGHRRAGTYSGGMRRRLDLAGALVAHPRVVVLDEPTTGLDPRSRNETWGVVRELLADGAGVLLTTQYLEEADQLADDITVIDRGRVVARGTPSELKKRVMAENVLVTVAGDGPEFDRGLEVVTAALAEVGDGAPQVDRAARTAQIPVAAGAEALKTVLRRADAAEVELVDVAVRRSSLDDVFLSLTGPQAASNDANEATP